MLSRLSPGIFLQNISVNRKNISRCYATRTRKKNYYDVLETTPKASSKQIKASYYRLSKKFHPDLNKSSDAQAKFAEISEAYEVLGNKKHRYNYDMGSFNPLDIRSGHAASQVDTDFKDLFKYRGKFGERKQAPTGRSKYYNFDEFYREHYGEARREQAAERKRQYEHLQEHYEEMRRRDTARLRVVQAVMGVVVMNVIYAAFRRFKGFKR